MFESRIGMPEIKIGDKVRSVYGYAKGTIGIVVEHDDPQSFLVATETEPNHNHHTMDDGRYGFYQGDFSVELVRDEEKS